MSESRHPIQPIVTDAQGVRRFKANAIVQSLLEFSRVFGFDMNTIARRDFATEDRQQFAQLIGYSLSGYGELSYVDDDAYGVAATMLEEEVDARQARILYLEGELLRVRSGLREPIARLFGVHPDDLKRNG